MEVSHVPSPWPRSVFWQTVTFFWTLPNSLLGFLFLILFWAAKNPFISWYQDGGIDIAFEDQGWLAKRFRRAGWGAFTCGFFMFYWGEDQATRAELRFHERQHIRQQTQWGMFWLPLYLLVLLYGFFRFRSWMLSYSNHFFEQSARVATKRWLDQTTSNS
jgi:hypothetical protein